MVIQPIVHRTKNSQVSRHYKLLFYTEHSITILLLLNSCKLPRWLHKSQLCILNTSATMPNLSCFFFFHYSACTLHEKYCYNGMIVKGEKKCTVPGSKRIILLLQFMTVPHPTIVTIHLPWIQYSLCQKYPNHLLLIRTRNTSDDTPLLQGLQKKAAAQSRCTQPSF